IDDGVDRCRDGRAAAFHARGAGERTGNGNEELREDTPGIGVLDRPTYRRLCRRVGGGDDASRLHGRDGGAVNVSCPECRSVFRVDPTRIPSSGVRARCSVCGAVMMIGAGASIDEEFAPSRQEARSAGPMAVATPAASIPPIPAPATAAGPRSTPIGTAPVASSSLPPNAWPTPAAGGRVVPQPPGAQPSVPTMPRSTPSVPPLPPQRPGAPPNPSGAAGGPRATPLARPVMFTPRIGSSVPPGGAQHPPGVGAPTPPRGGMAARPTMPPLPPVPPVPPARGFRPTGPALTPIRPSAAVPPRTPPSIASSAGLTARPAPPPSSFAPPAATPRNPSSPAGTPQPPAVQRGVGSTPARTPINPFLANDPNAKARRLSRALISDLLTYFPQRREEGLRNGTLKELFREEIKKSYEEYVDQVGKDFAESTPHFQNALNDILAGGQQLF